MFKNEYILTVDLKKSTTAVTPKFVQYDNATLVFKILDNGKAFDLTGFTKAEVAHKRPDGVTVVGNADIEHLSNGKSAIRYEYLGNEMHKDGFAEVSLSIFSNDKKVSIYPFKVEIVSDLRDKLIDDAKKEVGLLQELIAEVSDILVDAHDAIDNANNAVVIATQATTDATAAVVNANLAITNAQNAANETIQVKDDTLTAKHEAEQAAINANSAVADLVHRGEYNSAIPYVEKNIVSFDGSSYINIASSTGVSPTNPVNWRLIGEKGKTGIQGIQGIPGAPGSKGDTGKGFSIAKIYSSVAQMYADYSNPLVTVGDFVLINTSDINNPENAMLFVKTSTNYSYLTDLSGAQGIKGEAGKDGASFTWRGVYSNTITYPKDNVVSSNGSSFIALKSNLGIAPTNDGINWSMVAQRGVDGTGSVSSINSKFPNVNGDVALAPSDIGASPSNHTHAELHTHTNKTVLDAITDDAGQLKYNGTAISGSVTSVNGQVGIVTGLETVADSNNKLDTKVDKVTGKVLSSNDYTDTEKTKLSGIAANANNYSHPATHSPSIITQDANNRFMTDVEKTKLNGIETGAQVNTITSVNGATGAISGLATDTSVDNKIGVLSDLSTTVKTDLVKAINEINAKPTGGDTTEIAKQINMLYKLSTGIMREQAYTKLMQDASSRIDGGTVFAHDMNGNIIGMTLDEANSQNIAIRDGKMLLLTSPEGARTVTDSTVIAGSYDTSGNGGRKLVRLTNGWFVATVKTTTGFSRYRSVDGITWSAYGVVGNFTMTDSASVSNGNTVYTLYGQGTTNIQLVSYGLNGTGINKNDTVSSNDTAVGSVTLEINPEGTLLHAAWLSKNVTYASSFNIRYVKGVISAVDGSVVWGAVEQVTAWNSSNVDTNNPSILLDYLGDPKIVYSYKSASSSQIFIKIRTTGGWGGQNDYKTIHNGVAHIQSSPSAIFVPQSVNGLANGIIASTWHGFDATHTTTNYIRFSKSVDGGVNWSTTQKLVAGQNASITSDSSGVLYIEYDRSGSTYFIKSTNNGDSWGIETLKGVGVNPSTLFVTTMNLSKPLSIRKGVSSVAFNGEWEESIETPSLFATAVYNIPSTDFVGAFVKKIGATTVQAYVNDTLMDSELVDSEYQFTKQLTKKVPVKLRLDLSRVATTGGENDYISRILGGRS